MNAFINYLIEANFGLCVFLLVYVLLLSSETNFNFNRGYLLLSLVVATLVPLLKVGNQGEFIPTLVIQLPAVTTGGASPYGTEAGGLIYILCWIYLFGVALFSVRLVLQLARLRALFRNAIAPRSHHHRKILETQDSAPIFSFFDTIHLGNAGQLSVAEKEQIIEHESVHIDQLHSLDLLLVELISVLFWFNPAILFTKNY